VGLSVTTEMLKSKVKSADTYCNTANYWASLANYDDDNNSDNNIQNYPSKQQTEHTSALTKPPQHHTTVGADFTHAFRRWLQQRCGMQLIPKTERKGMVLDSGAMSHFVRGADNLPATGSLRMSVTLPNGESIKATHTVDLPFEQLSLGARHAHVLPHLTTHSLVSISKLTDTGYMRVFHPGNLGVTIHSRKSISIRQQCKPVLQGWRDENGLWKLGYNNALVMSKRQKHNNSTEQTSPDIERPKETAANVYSLPSIARVIIYLHAAAGFPTKLTWLKATACGNYKSWSGVTTANVKKHFPESIETQKGHMKKQRQNVWSTKIRVLGQDEEHIELDRMLKKQNIMVKVIHARTTMYTNQTGCFPVQSSRGNRLIMVLYKIDGNYIDAEPMQDSKDNSLVRAYNTLWARVTKSGKVKQTVHILDNEALAHFKEEIRKNCDLQLVPPDTHR
jgi:hypothetical protein